MNLEINKKTLLLICLITLFSQAQSKGKGFWFYESYYCKINDTLYAAAYEVTNIDYKEFLKTLTYAEYEKCKIDSSRWVKEFCPDFNPPMAKYYHSHSAFNRYPVLNVSQYGAEKYCEWLSYNYKSMWRRSVIFKLPTEQEWIELSNTNPTTKLPYNLLDGKSSDGGYLENAIAICGTPNDYHADGGFYTVRVDTYQADKNGLYNVIGNVAEMTTLDGVSKGGSWENCLVDCTTDKIQTYPTPDLRVGFRVVAILRKRKQK